jgi:signal transduction histidine kinase
MFEISLLDLAPTFAPAARASLDDALAAVGDACAAAARARDVALRMPPATSLAVALDADRLALVLINLVDNAIKHGRAGGCVGVALEAVHARTVSLVVDDDGPGVPPAERERIFALGERGGSGGGTGIGLALVRMILERAGGRVEAGDAPSGGARFTVVLPRAGRV